MKPTDWSREIPLARKDITDSANLTMKPDQTAVSGVFNPAVNIAIDSGVVEEALLFRPRLHWVNIDR